jgi:hypothetical protein
MRFRLRLGSGSSADLSWASGAGQLGYLIVRLDFPGQTSVILPPEGPLPPSATSYTDAPPPGHTGHCYILVALQPGDRSDLSPLTCFLPRTRTGTVVAQGFSIGSNGPNVDMAWTPAPGALLQVLVIAPLEGGSAPTFQPLEPTTNTAVQPRGEVLTCYAIYSERSPETGMTDFLCVAPADG